MQVMDIQLKRFALLCVVLALVCAVVLSGLSRAYQERNPVQALRFNPFNTDASIARMAQGLTAVDNLAQLPALEETGRTAVRFSPINALAFGLLGEVYFGAGDEQTATALFDTALSLSKTEANALLRTLAGAIEDSDIDAAIDKLDILLRRWPERTASLAPIIADLLRNPDGYRAVIAALKKKPLWRKRFLWFLNERSDTVRFAYRLQLDLGSVTDRERNWEILETIWALLDNKHNDLAYRLFLLTLSDTERTQSGYVFNGKFALEPSERPFDWRIRSNSGVSISRLADNQSGNALSMRLLGKPVKSIAISQFLYLPTGRYRLDVNLNAANLAVPKELFLHISCNDPRVPVIRLDIPAGTYRDETLSGAFEVPNDRCGFYRLGFGTDLIAESFRTRYSGTLNIRSIALSKIAQ